MSALRLPVGPWIIGHRGAAGEELENTLASVGRGVAAGVDMIEVDLQLTADERIVVFHDETLERLAGDRRAVERVRWRELSEIELRAAGAGPSHRLPLLAELFAAVPRRLVLNLEAKVRHAPRRLFARRLVDEIGRRRQILVSSFDWRILAALRRLAPGLPLAPLSRRDGESLLAAGDELDAFSLHCHHSLASRRLLDSPRRRRRPVLVYTVNRPQRARTLLRRGVRGVFTDLPAAMVRSLARWPP